MVRSMIETCLLYKKEEDTLTASVLLQVDHSFIVGKKQLREIDNQEPERFLSKHALQL